MEIEKKSQKIGLYIVGMIIDLAILVFALLPAIYSYLSVSDAFQGPDDLYMMLVLAAGFIWLFIINVVALRRVKKNKIATFWTALCMKCTIMSFVLAVFTYFLDGSAGIEVCIVLAVIGLIFGLIAAAVAKGHNKAARGKAKKSGQMGSGITIKHFTADKAKWAWDSVAGEYADYHQVMVESLDEETKDKLYDYAAMPQAYFLTWLIMHDRISASFDDDLGDEYIESFKARKESPVELIGRIDYVLSMDEIEPSLQSFMDDYYDNPISVDRCYQPSRRGSFYYLDYYKVIRNESHLFYLVDFSWDNYDKLEKLIDDAYKYHLSRFSYTSDDDGITLENVYIKGLDSTVTVTASQSLLGNEEYTEKCRNHVANWSGDMLNQLREKIKEYVGAYDDTDEILKSDDILKTVDLQDMIIDEPFGDEPAYVLRGEAEFEEEHGISVVIRGDYVLQIAYYSDYDDPWCYEMTHRYMLTMASEETDFSKVTSLSQAALLEKNGKLSKMYLIGTEFGGSESGDNILYVPEYAAQWKKNVDVLLEMLMISGVKVCNYSCKPEYKENSVVPWRVIVSAENVQGKALLRDGIMIY